MSYNESDWEQLSTFREVYKDLESLYDIFPKLCQLSGTEYWALSMIHEGVTTQHGICERLSLSRQTVNSAFKQLIKKGLIYLETREDNLRTKQVHLTKLGEEFISKNIDNMHALEEKVWHQMDHEGRQELTLLLYQYKVLLKDALVRYQEQLNSSSEDK